MLYHRISCWERGEQQLLGSRRRTHPANGAEIHGFNSPRALWDLFPELREDFIRQPRNGVPGAGDTHTQLRSSFASAPDPLADFLQPAPEGCPKFLSLDTPKQISWAQISR